jgi:hypothetical protein
LANANSNVNQLMSSDGKVLTNPFSFQELYGHYGNSWRVKPSDSLLRVCGEAREQRNPEKPFNADQLKPDVAARAEAICKKAGVKEGTLFEACTLDVAVTGDERAAQVFVGAPAPIAVGVIK